MGVQKARNRVVLFDKPWDIYSVTGLFGNLFRRVFKDFMPTLALSQKSTKGIAKGLSPQACLMMVLYFLQHASSYRITGTLFGVSAATVQRDLYFLVP